MKRLALVLIVAGAWFVGNAPLAAAQPTVIATIPVGDQPYWLGANPTTDRIYVGNFQSDNVSVIHGASNTEIDTDGNPANGISRIPVGDGPAGVAANSTTNRIYVGNRWSDNVSVIDGATYTEIDTDGNPANGITRIPVGYRPHGVAVNPTTNRIYVANWGSDNVSVIDGGSDTVDATIPVGGGPVGVAVNPNTNRIYVTNQGSDNVSVIDGDSDAVETTVSVGNYPYGVAANPTTNQIYVSNYVSNSASDNVSVMDGDKKTVVAIVPVGDDPNGVAANPTTNCIYVANYGSDTVSVIQGVGPVGGIAELPDLAPGGAQPSAAPPESQNNEGVPG